MARTTGNAKDLITFTRASTGTFLGSNGLLQTAAINTPRVEYDANGVAKGLLIEEARTNLDPYSATQTANGWAAATAGDGVTPTTTDVTSVLPTGETSSSVTELTLNRVTADAVNYSIWRKNITITGVAHTGSIYLKAARPQDVGKTVTFYNNGGGTIDFVYVTLTDDWQRTSSVTDVSAGSGNAWLSIALYGTLGSTGEVKVLTWGSQQEAGSFPTSYIPTSGATATRSADIASVSVSEFGYNQAQGSVVVNFEASRALDSNAVLVNPSDGTTSNRMTLWGGTTSGTTLFVVNSGVAQATLVGGIPAAGTHKTAIAYATNDFALTLDAGAIQSDTLGTVPTVSQIDIGRYASDLPLNGHIKSLNYYPLRLSDAKLQELTS